MIQYKIKALLVREGLSQEVLASVIGKTRESLNHKLNGRIPFSLEEAFIIAKFFNKPIEDIFLIDKFTQSE